MKAAACLILLAACGGGRAPAEGPASLALYGTAAETQTLRERVPEAYARMEAEAKLAQEASVRGDEVGASLHNERARARYAHAQILLRAEHAKRAELAETAELRSVESKFTDLEAERDRALKELDQAEKARAIRERVPAPGAAGATSSKEREAARSIARGAFLEEATALCDAAALLGKEPQELLASLRTAGPAIDTAIELRAKCLDALTQARRDRSAAPSEHPDQLFAELSNAGGYRIRRDERGVVVSGPDLASRKGDLTRIAKAHPSFAIQVVMPTRTPDATAAEWKQALSGAHVVSGNEAAVVFVSAQ
jgi:hypothetical protein